MKYFHLNLIELEKAKDTHTFWHDLYTNKFKNNEAYLLMLRVQNTDLEMVKYIFRDEGLIEMIECLKFEQHNHTTTHSHSHSHSRIPK